MTQAHESLEHKSLPVVNQYPYIGISTFNKTIVLFRSAQCGTVIREGEGELYGMGTFKEDWGEHVFEKYNGVLMLSNGK